MNCPICKNKDLRHIYELAGGSATQHKLHQTLESALGEEKVSVDLYGCKKCGFVFNAGFNAGKIEYSLNYDNTTDNSEYFYSYLVGLAGELYEKYGLADKRIIEVGCGKGHFMKILYDLGAKNIKGFDPSYIRYDPLIDDLVVREFLREGSVKEKADFIVCRHVLEHIQDPDNFVRSVSECLAKGGTAYFESPDLEWTVEHEVFFDFFYEHCNYFTKSSLTYLFRQFGFSDFTLKNGLDGQFLQMEARRGGTADIDLPGTVDFGRIEEFLDRKISEYGKMIPSFGRFIIWGAGAKGVTFLNRLDISSDRCPYVIDINPNKQNKFVPITGQKIASPEILREEEADNIIIMNPAYGEEIKAIAKKNNYKGNFILL